MIAYKAFNEKLQATMGNGIFQFEQGKTYEEKECKCTKNGFHCTENPLDVLRYYHGMDTRFFIVDAGGDINQDGCGTKISCTKLTLLKEISRFQLAALSCEYMRKYPERETESNHAVRDEGKCNKEGDFLIVRGKDPRVARDTEVLRESGYNTVAEFALAEYGMSKDVVSRYIAINDKYSTDGYSEELKGEYKAYGYAKLTEMLTLPDVVADAIGPEMTRGQIREVKREIAEEEQISDLEVMMEEQDPVQEVLGNNLKKHLHQYLHDNPEQYVRLFGEIPNHKWTLKETHESIRDILAPSGIAMLAARVAGVGKLLMRIKDIDTDVELINVRSGEKESYTWTGLAVAISDLQPTIGSGEKAWEYLYGEPFPKKKKGSCAGATAKADTTEKTKKKLVEKPTDQIPGQDSIMHHQEFLPEGMKEEAPEEKEESRESEMVTGEIVEDQGEKTKKECAKTINAIDWNINTGNYKKAYEATEELLQCLKKLI